MFYLHVLMSMLAVWRITELFTQDRITDRLRKRFPTYLWQCPRCMSVWAAAFATLMLALAPASQGITPWLNWPFALAWLYLWHNESVYTRRVSKRGRKFMVELDASGNAKWQNELTPQELTQILGPLLRPQQNVINGEAKPVPPMPGTPLQ